MVLIEASSTIVFFLSFIISSSDKEAVIRDFITPGRLDGMVESQNENLKLIQLNLKSDSLYQIVKNKFPDLELLNGPASYHRIVPDYWFNQIRELPKDLFEMAKLSKKVDTNYFDQIEALIELKNKTRGT